MNILKKKHKYLNKIILFVRIEDCQGYNNFRWVGKIVKVKEFDGIEKAIIHPLIANDHYIDIRDKSFNQAIKVWPVNDIQEVNDLLVIFN